MTEALTVASLCMPTSSKSNPDLSYLAPDAIFRKDFIIVDYQSRILIDYLSSQLFN